jgi:kynurenine formamidase
MMKWFGQLGVLALLSASLCALANPFDGYCAVDLTHAFDENTIYWPTEKGFEHDKQFEGATEGGWYYTAYSVRTAEHGGTHLDAPIHFAAGTWTADQVPLSSLILPAVVIDVTDQAGVNRDYLLTADGLREWEARHGQIPQGSAVLMSTGFAKFWPNHEHYMGTAKRGHEALAELHFPGLSESAARFLANERGVAAVGLDTPSIDYGQSKDFIAHQVLYSQDIIGFENIASMEALPATGAWTVALPMKIRDGSGGPLRIIALIPSS